MQAAFNESIVNAEPFRLSDAVQSNLVDAGVPLIPASIAVERSMRAGRIRTTYKLKLIKTDVDPEVCRWDRVTEFAS